MKLNRLNIGVLPDFKFSEEQFVRADTLMSRIFDPHSSCRARTSLYMLLQVHEAHEFPRGDRRHLVVSMRTRSMPPDLSADQDSVGQKNGICNDAAMVTAEYPIVKDIRQN